MSLWRFGVCVESFVQSKGGATVQPPTVEEFEAMKAKAIHKQRGR